jgi:hypothetical protein
MNDTPVDASIEDPPATQPAPPPWRAAIDNPWAMLGMLFFVTAALGLPFLWMSRGFSTASKALLSIVVIAYTVLILWLFWLIMVWCWTRISDAMG